MMTHQYEPVVEAAIARHLPHVRRHDGTDVELGRERREARAASQQQDEEERVAMEVHDEHKGQDCDGVRLHLQ